MHHDPLTEIRRLLEEIDDRLVEIEERQAVLDAGLAIARWLIAVLIPTAAVIVAVWQG